MKPGLAILFYVMVWVHGCATGGWLMITCYIRRERQELLKLQAENAARWRELEDLKRDLIDSKKEVEAAR